MRVALEPSTRTLPFVIVTPFSDFKSSLVVSLCTPSRLGGLDACWSLGRAQSRPGFAQERKTPNQAGNANRYQSIPLGRAFPFGLITQTSLVQVQPPQPIKSES